MKDLAGAWEDVFALGGGVHSELMALLSQRLKQLSPGLGQ
jgi:hypothetical protein